jgi:hypothetical protein
LLYAGALLSLYAAVIWLSVISSEHSEGAFAGWSVLFFGSAQAPAFWFRARERRLLAGLFAVVGLGLFAVMVGAFFRWWGWLGSGDSPFAGTHWSVLAIEVLVVLAALVDLKIFRFPLLVAVAVAVAWLLVTDLLSSGGNWSAWVTLLIGLALFVVGSALDSGDRRPYGFWVHVVAGLTVGGALLFFWHASDTQWALITVVALVFIGIGAAMRRSSYAVLGALALVVATGWFSSSFVPFFPFDLVATGTDSDLTGYSSSTSVTAQVSTGPVPQPAPVRPVTPEPLPSSGEIEFKPTAPWQGPLAYTCLGLFLAVLGALLYRRPEEEPAST